MNEFFLYGADQLELHVVRWDEVEMPKAVIQISHGMAEHILRYAEFAEYLNSRGYIVIGHDHRGHGTTVKTDDNIGYFSDSEGWLKLVSDIHVVTMHIKETYPELPIYIFGHSMGSFATRHYLGLFGTDIEGAIICGTGNNSLWMNKAALALAKYEVRKKGRKHKSTLMTKLSFGSFNKKFKPNKTECDWLCRDEVEVYKYIEDPYCGSTFTSSFYEDFLSGLIELSSPTVMNKIPKDKPYFFISGSADPLSKNGSVIHQLVNQYKALGIQKVDYKLYENARHELTNETNKQEVYQDVADWIDKQLINASLV